MKKVLLQKNGWLAMEIAREFLTLNMGDRIPTISSFCEKFETARGTVQIALKLLGDVGAIQLCSRGTLGTYIEHMNYELLLEVADIKTIVGVMPLPYSKLYEGFASGIYRSAKDKKFPLYLAYMRGSENRINLLLEKRYSFAVVSKLAANEFINQGKDIMIAMDFGRNTYVSEHGIIFRKGLKKELKNGLKVGIDESSVDQATLTRTCFRDYEVFYVDVYYNQILDMLEEGTIDVAVWNTDELKDHSLRDRYIPMRANAYMESNTESVIVINRSEEYLFCVLNKFISKEKVLQIQQGVLKGDIIPCY